MADITQAQRAQIREYLGWSMLGHSSGPGYRLESSMDALNLAEKAADQTRVLAQLTAIDAIDTRITEAYDRLKASAVGSITLNAAEIGMLKGEARRLCKSIAAILGVEVRACKFGGGAQGGEVWTG